MIGRHIELVLIDRVGPGGVSFVLSGSFSDIIIT